MRRSITLLAVAVSLALPASAGAFTFTPVHPPANLGVVERAISFQVNRQVARAWRVDPVSFGAGGIPVYFTSEAVVSSAWLRAGGGNPRGGIAGFHSYDPATGQAVIWVWRSADRAFWTNTLSHEIIETEVDPSATHPRLEIADAVADYSYRLFGVSVSDWLLPSGYAFRPLWPTP